MKIELDSKGYDFLEMRKEASGEICVILSARAGSGLSTVVNSALVTEVQIKELIKSLELSSDEG